jgi:hypothetical protein
MITITIDPGRHSGLAWWRDGELVLVRRLELGRHARPDILRCDRELQDGLGVVYRCEDPAPSQLVIEGQWVVAGRGAGDQQVIDLVVTRAAWTHAAQSLWPEISVEVVQPGRWMPRLVGSAKGQAERVEKAIRVIYQERAEAERWTPDQIAAVGIGRWWLVERRLRG